MICTAKKVSTSAVSIIQLVHSFEVNISISQHKNSDVHRGETGVNIIFEGGLTNPEVN